MAPSPLPLLFTQVFVDLYHALPTPDVTTVDAMLDALETGHGEPEMRNIVQIADHTLYATPRIYAETAIYRITWTYDDRNRPTAITCITVAEI